MLPSLWVSRIKEQRSYVKLINNSSLQLHSVNVTLPDVALWVCIYIFGCLRLTYTNTPWLFFRLVNLIKNVTYAYFWSIPMWIEPNEFARQRNVWSAQAGEPRTSLFSLSKQALIFSEGWSPHQNLIWKWNLIALLSGSTVPISLFEGPYQYLAHYPITPLLVETGAQILVPPSLKYSTPSLFKLSNHILVWFYGANAIFTTHHVAYAGPASLQQMYPSANALMPHPTPRLLPESSVRFACMCV